MVRSAASILFLIGPAANASFDAPFNSVRSASMGEASLASIGEAPSIFTNPAGISRMRSSEASFMYDRMFAGLPGVGTIGMGYLAVAVPTRLGSFGFGLGDFSAAGMKEERTIALSYGFNIGSFLQLGVTAKDLYNHYTVPGDALTAGDAAIANGTSKNTFGFDVGLLASVAGPVKAGFSVKNVNSPDVGVSSQDRLSREVDGGLLLDISEIGFRASGDMVFSDAGFGANQRIMPMFGMEKSVMNTGLTVRGGINPMEFTGGIGLQMGQVGLDYGFAVPRELRSDLSGGTHRVGMNFKFGQTAARTAKADNRLNHTTKGTDTYDYLDLDNKALFGH